MAKVALSASLGFGLYYTFFVQKRPKLYFQKNGHNEDLLSKVPTLHRPFRPTWYAFNANLQIVLHLLRNKLFQRQVEYRREVFAPLPGDPGVISLDWAATTVEVPSAPIVLLLHTMTGGSHEGMAGFVDMCERRGWRFCVFNRRGHAGVSLRSPKFNIVGCVKDMRAVVDHVHQSFPEAPIFVAGLSAGSALLARYLGEVGEDGPVRAGFCVSPAYDLNDCFERCSFLLGRFMLRFMKQTFLEPNVHLLSDVPGFQECSEAASVDEFRRHVHYMSGFSSGEEWLEHSNPMVVVEQIRKPLLVLNALDDPVSHKDNVRFDLAELIPSAILATTDHGSHVCWYEGSAAHSWLEQVIFEYFDAVHEHPDL